MLCWSKPTTAKRMQQQRLALFPSGQQLDFIGHLGGVVEMLHCFLAAGGALGFFHQAHVLVFEVRQFLLHSLISRYATRGFRFIGRNVLTVTKVALSGLMLSV